MLINLFGNHTNNYKLKWSFVWLTAVLRLLLQCAVRMEGAAEAGLPPHPDHTLRPSGQHQRQLLPTDLRHLPPGAREPAAHRPGRHRHLHHHPEQGGDASTHLLQGGEESQQQHGERDTGDTFNHYNAAFHMFILLFFFFGEVFLGQVQVLIHQQ